MYITKWSDEYNSWCVFYEYNSIEIRFVKDFKDANTANNARDILNLIKDEFDIQVR